MERTLFSLWGTTLMAGIALLAGLPLVLPVVELQADEGQPQTSDEQALEELASELDAAEDTTECEDVEAVLVGEDSMADYEARERKQAIEQREQLTKDPKWRPTHEQVARIEVGAGLQNFCLDGKGRILACCADNKIRIYTRKGKLTETWDLDFSPQAVGVSKKSGTIFVGGNGQIATLATDGRVLKSIDFPRGMTDEELEEAVQAQVASQKEMFENYLKGLKAQLSETEKLLGDEKDKTEDVDYGCIAGMSATDGGFQIQFKENTPAASQHAVLKMYLESIQQQYQGPESLAKSIRQQMKMSSQQSTYTGVAVSDTDLFVVCSAPGYSYNAWRLTHELSDATIIVKGLRGCCGQMDCQTYNGDLWIPVNAEHKVYRYDRDGEVISSFGTFDREAADGFGGCCEPKNMRFSKDGFAYCAESGPPVCVKRFSVDGEFQDVVCFPLYATGCVRVSVDMAGDKVFLLSPNESAIYVFAPKET